VRRIAPSRRLGTGAPAGRRPAAPAVFVGRDEMLSDLRARLTRGGSFALSALNGLPGRRQDDARRDAGARRAGDGAFSPAASCGLAWA